MKYLRIIPFQLLACSFLLALLLLPWNQMVQAAPNAQLTPFPTPTPGPDGRIIYIVQPNDTLWRIAAITGITLDQLRSLNNLKADDPIQVGQQLLIGLGGPLLETATPGPSPTRAATQLVPTSSAGTGDLCVILYNDNNGDSMRQETELSIPGGAISISNRSGSVSQTVETGTGTDFQCFEGIAEGDYNVTVAVPDGYNATTTLNQAVRVAGGDKTYMSFGAQENSITAAETTIIPEAPGKSPLLGIIGGVLLLAGVSLGIYAGLLRRK